MNDFYQIHKSEYFRIHACYDQIYPVNFNMNIHHHEGLEIMYVVSGEMHLILYQDPIKIYKIYADDFVVLESNIPHKISIPSRETRIVNVEMIFQQESEFLNQYSLEVLAGLDKKIFIFLSEMRGALKVRGSFGIHNTLSEIFNTVSEYDFNCVELYFSALTLLSQIGYNYDTMMGNNIRNNRNVRTAIMYIMNERRELGVKEIAQQAGISAVYLQKLFKEAFGCGVMEYVNKMRINIAAQLIKNHTEQEIVFVAHESGFGNVKSFERNFFKFMDTTPTKYRKECQKSKNQRFDVN